MGINRRTVGRAAVIAGWALAAGMSGIAVIRLFRSESHPQLIGLQGVGMWLLLPAAPLAIAAAATRQRSLAAVAAVLAIGNVVWVGDHFATGDEQSAPMGTATIRLVTANMLLSNTEVAGLSQDLLGTNADVILLQEFTPEHLAQVRAAGLLEHYPEQVLDPRPGFHGSAILSTLPINSGGSFELADSPMTRADIATAAGPISVVNVHTLAPINEVQVPGWREQMTLLADMAAAAPGPLIMAGDFNATADHAPMEELLDSGMRDAYTEAGSGFGATWPQWDGPMIPVMRLDHVLVNSAIAVLSAQVQSNRGSDHRRLLANLAVPGPGALPS